MQVYLFILHQACKIPIFSHNYLKKFGNSEAFFTQQKPNKAKKAC